MDIFTLAAKLKLDSKDFVKEIDKSEGLFANFGNKLKNGIGAIAKIGAASIGAATASLVPFFKSATEAYANYEQLVGGVDTLFKDSSKKVQEYAQKAWSTAGMSANEYMETATSFSASLLQGLKGDTSKAADVADMAIRDMSDNANKMGTNISAIQNAYQGFAKQNYTMLDNLKLGYGGTKTEMERLLKDAQKLTGKKYNLNNLADVYEAIHAIQQEMGITGTTSKEASTTIEGSVKSLKAAWQDALVAITSGDKPIRASAKVLSHAFKTVLSNLVPTIKRALSGFGEFIQHVGPMIGKELPGLIADLVPGFISAGWDMITGIGKGLIEGVKAIKWPSWDDIKEAAAKAWVKIKKGVAEFGGLIFGRDKNGEVKWPTWDDVKEAAKTAWEKIKETAISLGTEFGKLVFGTNEKGEVNWPTWDDVKEAAKVAWGKIKDAAVALGAEFGKLIFGTNEKGEVNWPSWEDVVDAAKVAWGKIVSAASKLGTEFGKLVFGTTENGDVKWPSWEDVLDGAKAAWNKIKEAALSLGTEFGKIIFGTDEKGEVKWPDPDDIKAKAEEWWNNTAKPAIDSVTNWVLKIFENPTEAVENIKKHVSDWWEGSGIGSAISSGLDWTLKLFNVPEEKAEKIKEVIGNWWSGVKETVEKAVTWFLSLPSMPDPNTAGKKLREVISSWWNTVKTQLAGIAEILFGVSGPEDENGSKTKEAIKTWWDNKVVPLLTGAINFVLGLFDLPSVEDQKQRIIDWWEDVKTAVGNLILDIFPFLRDDGFTTESGQHFTGTSFNMQSQGQSGPQRNRTVTETASEDQMKGHATGAWNIPYDNYRAVLHRNEMVLNATQAREYREGTGGVFDASALYGIVERAIREGIERANIVARSYLNGRDITDEVARNMSDDIRAMRFRPV